MILWLPNNRVLSFCPQVTRNPWHFARNSTPIDLLFNVTWDTKSCLLRKTWELLTFELGVMTDAFCAHLGSNLWLSFFQSILPKTDVPTGQQRAQQASTKVESDQDLQILQNLLTSSLNLVIFFKARLSWRTRHPQPRQQSQTLRHCLHHWSHLQVKTKNWTEELKVFKCWH